MPEGVRRGKREEVIIGARRRQEEVSLASVRYRGSCQSAPGVAWGTNRGIGLTSIRGAEPQQTCLVVTYYPLQSLMLIVIDFHLTTPWLNVTGNYTVVIDSFIYFRRVCDRRT